MSTNDRPIAIEYLGVQKAFDVPVLSGVDMQIRRGDLVAIVGRSGTGKSVLLKTTNGLIVPDAGDVRIDGVSIFEDPTRLAAARRDIGYVFQTAALFDSASVYENVLMGIPERELRRIETREALARICLALEAVRLNPRAILSKKPAELSGGMRKRVGLARAMVGRPRFLLCDEPVTGLDPVTTAAIDELIREVSEKLEATTVLVTHDVEGALSLSDRVALLDEGTIRFFGTPEEFRQSTDPLVRAFADRRVARETAGAFFRES
jgi:phospholipid/cholesterol/gamma-HCH transport system ATP-binding protein